jgi:hypothetical protein
LGRFGKFRLNNNHWVGTNKQIISGSNNIVNFMVIKKVKEFFNRRKQARERKLNEWIEILSKEFSGIQFPILILEPNHIYVIDVIEDYSLDPDLYFHRFPNGTTFIDSKGCQFNWKRNNEIQSNVPDKKLNTMSLDNFKSLLKTQFSDIDTELFSSEESIATIIKRIPDKSRKIKAPVTK